MVVKKSKSVALDSRDLNPLFSLMKGYGPLMALGIIAVLSVCAAFFIYRSAKGQSKRNGEKSVTEAGEEEERNPIPKKRGVENKHAESTGIMEDVQGMTPADGCEMMPVVYPPETSNFSSSGPHNQEEVDDSSCLDQLSESCVDAQGAWRDTAADYDTVQNGSSTPEVGCDDFTDHSEMDDGETQGDAEEQEVMEVRSDDDLVVSQCGEEHQKGFVGDGQMHTFASESLEELSACLEKACLKMDLGDMHERETDDKLSSPDSAYGDGESEVENSCRSRDPSSSPTDTVDHDFTYYQQSCNDCPTEQSVRRNLLQDDQKTIEALTWSMQTVSNRSEGLLATHRCLPEMQFYKPDFLGFSPECFTGLMDGCMRMKTEVASPVAQAPVQSESSEQDAQVESKGDKTEINIMEATMDNNEWLTGNEGHGDQPWLSLSEGGETSSVAEGCRQDAEWDTEKSEASEEFSATYTTSSDDGDDLAATKRVATVPPLSQTARVTFSVHYITNRPQQFLAVTGNQQELGAWQGFVALERGKDGFWANTVALPVDGQVEWKFVLVEDGKICRWEECSNRHLVLTGQEEDIHIQRWWGCL
ncbi:hypothetical protein ACEWY4_004079 [Coilia grayii]|uniref:CBM20 domain-containing protein n=1 Tax=Coilia grayii TaxID=363190 RepID=A0ABD1KKH9_9TELE